MANRKTKKRRSRPSGSRPGRAGAGPDRSETQGPEGTKARGPGGGRWVDGSARRPARPRLVRWLVPALVAVAGLAFVQLWRTGSPSTGPKYVNAGPSVDPTSLPGMRSGPAPWGPMPLGLRERLAADGMPPSDGTAMHIHAHLDVFVDEKRVAVPSQIGISQQLGLLAPLHTHDDSGIIHVESPSVRTYTLGEFFDVWAVRLSSTCVGGYCNAGDRRLQVFVDGRRATGNPRDLALFSHEEVVVAFGTQAELPRPVPSSFGFHLFE